jgi:hypothetical protein
MLASDRDWCGTEAILREYGRHRSALGEFDQQEVAAIGLANAGHGNPQAHARNWVKARGFRGVETNGHGELLAA